MIATVAIIMALATEGHAQGITLPSPRTVGPSPEVARLVEMVNDAAGWLSDSNPHRISLEVVRYRLLLAPFKQDELKEIRNEPTEEKIWTLLYRDVMKDGNAPVIRAVLKKERNLDADCRKSDIIAFAVGMSSEELEAGDAMTKLENLLKDNGACKGKSGAASFSAHRDSVPRESSGVQLAAMDSVPAREKGPRKVESVSELTEREAIVLAALIKPGPDDKLRARLDTLGRLAQLVAIQRKMKSKLFPVHSSEQARVFWRQRGIAPLNVAALTGSSSAVASYTELASPLLQAFRLSVNTVVVAANDAAAPPGKDAPPAPGSDAALLRFLNGGGQLNIGGALPIINAGGKNGAISSMILFAPRIGMTIGAMGAAQNDETAFVDPGVEWHINSADAVEHVGLFAQVRSGMVSGSEKFASSLGLSVKNFAYANVAFGLLLGDRYLLSGGRSMAGPRELRKPGWQVGMTVLRGPQ